MSMNYKCELCETERHPSVMIAVYQTGTIALTDISLHEYSKHICEMCINKIIAFTGKGKK